MAKKIAVAKKKVAAESEEEAVQGPEIITQPNHPDGCIFIAIYIFKLVQLIIYFFLAASSLGCAAKFFPFIFFDTALNALHIITTWCFFREIRYLCLNNLSIKDCEFSTNVVYSIMLYFRMVCVGPMSIKAYEKEDEEASDSTEESTDEEAAESGGEGKKSKATAAEEGLSTTVSALLMYRKVNVAINDIVFYRNNQHNIMFMMNNIAQSIVLVAVISPLLSPFDFSFTLFTIFIKLIINVSLSLTFLFDILCSASMYDCILKGVSLELQGGAASGSIKLERTPRNALFGLIGVLFVVLLVVFLGSVEDTDEVKVPTSLSNEGASDDEVFLLGYWLIVAFMFFYMCFYFYALDLTKCNLAGSLLFLCSAVVVFGALLGVIANGNSDCVSSSS